MIQTIQTAGNAFMDGLIILLNLALIIIGPVVLYFIIKAAVKNGNLEADKARRLQESNKETNKEVNP